MSRSNILGKSSYSASEDSSFNEDFIFTVENTVKKYTDNLLRFLEGISSRMAQLELHCHNLDKSIGEMRSELTRDHEESESKLNSLEKHMQEVHRSVEILRDKQELANTLEELTKLQLAQQEGSSAVKTQNGDRSSVPSKSKKPEISQDSHDQKMALVPYQVAAPHSVPSVGSPDFQHSSTSDPSPTLSAQGQVYSVPPPPVVPSQQSQVQYPPNQPQVQEMTRFSPHPQAHPQVNQNPQMQSGTPYQPQWPQHLQQQAQQPQHPIMQTQIRSSSQYMYPSYMPGQTNPAPIGSSMPMQQGASQPGFAGPEATSYGYGASSRPMQQVPPQQQVKVGYGTQSGDGYMTGVQRPVLPSGNTYLGNAAQAQYMQGPYPSQSFPPQNIPPLRSHPYNELIEKLVGMGYSGDRVVGLIQRLEESGQPVDLNSVLVRLNGGGASHRGWSS